jgi:hypothetical protein
VSDDNDEPNLKALHMQLLRTIGDIAKALKITPAEALRRAIRIMELEVAPEPPPLAGGVRVPVPPLPDGSAPFEVFMFPTHYVIRGKL